MNAFSAGIWNKANVATLSLGGIQRLSDMLMHSREAFVLHRLRIHPKCGLPGMVRVE